MIAETNELSVTRFIAAPPETVYRVWTERLGEWWAPRPYTTPMVELDLRAGGRARMDMRSPEGTDMPNDGVFLAVEPNHRIVLTNAISPDWTPRTPEPLAIVAIFEFAPEGSRTRYTASARHWDAATMKRHDEMGFHEGWGICAAQLAELAEAEAVEQAA